MMVTMVTDQLLQQTIDATNDNSQLSLQDHGETAVTQPPDGHISLASKCDRPSVLRVSTTDTATRLAVQDVLSPTQMPPKKRLRRSASVPGGTRSESRIQRYFVRHRQSSGLQQPVPVHPDVSGIVRTAVVTTLPAVSSGSADVRRDTTGQTLFHFSGSGKLPASPFRSIWVPMPVRPLSECRVESVVKPSASSLSCTAAVGTNHRELSANTASLQTRCHSQPGALLTRSSSLKRRRDEYRPWLDFRKMRETAYALDCGGCARSQSSTFLSTNEEESQESPASHTDRQLTDKLKSFSLSCETRLSEEPTSSSSPTLSSPQHGSSAASAVAAALISLMPGTCSSSSSEDDEVAAINVGCEEPPPLICSQQPTFTDSNSNGPDDSPAINDDLDLELIEQN